jgi:copper homeostasis protein (lipoprotein)
MTPRVRLSLVFVLLALVAACKPQGEQAAGSPVAGVPGTTVPASPNEDSERTWAGLLPCTDCQGIDTRLVLRTENGKRAYLLSETYLGGAGSGKNSFNRAGTWTEVQRKVGSEQETSYVLDPDQAAQQFILQPDGALELTGSDGKAPNDALAYRLQRL